MPISTPCIRVCILDPDTGLCEGCGRTSEEIAAVPAERRRAPRDHERPRWADAQRLRASGDRL